MQEIVVVFKFKVFDESIKQKAMNVLWAFPGVTSVNVEEEGQLKVTGEFDKFEMTNELKKIDEYVHILEDGVEAEAEVDKPSNDVSSSNWTTLHPYELWEQAKFFGAGAAERAKVIGAGVAETAKVIGAGAAESAKVMGAGAAGFININNKKEVITPQPKPKKVIRPQLFNEEDQLQPKKGEGILAGVAGFFERRKKNDELRRRLELMNKKVAPKKATTQNSEGQTQTSTTTGSYTESLWNTIRSKQSTGQASSSTQTQSTGQPNTSTQDRSA